MVDLAAVILALKEAKADFSAQKPRREEKVLAPQMHSGRNNRASFGMTLA
jgi:hypothetical protein